jgi:hypothetical protein
MDLKKNTVNYSLSHYGDTLKEANCVFLVLLKHCVLPFYMFDTIQIHLNAQRLIYFISLLTHSLSIWPQ